MIMKNLDWSEVNLKQVKKKSKRKSKKEFSYIWLKCYYVWKTKDTWDRIVYFSWTVISEDIKNKKVTVEFIDNNINMSNEIFIKTVHIKVLKFN